MLGNSKYFNYTDKDINNSIISMYKTGYSIDYIVKKYYKYKNRNTKPVKINGIVCFPAKIYDINYCRTYVVELIYNYIKHKQVV